MKLYFFLNKLYNNKTKFIKRLYKQQQKNITIKLNITIFILIIIIGILSNNIYNFSLIFILS